jgi:hypothetical protein
LREPHGLFAFAGFANHLHIRFLIKDEFETLPDHGMVVS